MNATKGAEGGEVRAGRVVVQELLTTSKLEWSRGKCLACPAVVRVLVDVVAYNLGIANSLQLAVYMAAVLRRCVALRCERTVRMSSPAAALTSRVLTLLIWRLPTRLWQASQTGG